MILTGHEIIKRFNAQEISIYPFKKTNVATNSYDISLDRFLIKYSDMVIDPKLEANYEIIEIPDEGYELKKGEFHLGSSVETIGSDYYVPLVHAKSDIARLGLFIHVTANLIDVGSKGNITFQLYPVNNLKIYPNMEIAQISFWKPYGHIDLYNGKYQNSKGPQVSKIYRDF